MSANKTKCVRLGDYIELCEERNSEGKYMIDDVRGISIEKKLIYTKANMEGVSLISYKIIKPSEFAYVTVTSRNGNRISLTINDTIETFIVSSSYEVFRCNEHLLPQYLYMFLSRTEFDRYSRFNSWGSARETFDWSELCRMEIPLPSISIQRELVNTYNGLKSLAEDNEALIAPLIQACEALVVDCKRKYDEVALGEYIEEVNQLNYDGSIKIVKSVSITKEFKDTGAKVDKSNLTGYKIVPPMHISYVQTTKNEKCFACALNRFGEHIVVTSVNKVIKTVDNQKLSMDFLYLFLSQKEFSRYAIFNSWGSARETFDWDELCRVKIPLPPPDVQQSIANLYHCIEEAKRIAAEAREQMRTLCPALIQKAIHS
jgi:hypothetical protein